MKNRFTIQEIKRIIMFFDDINDDYTESYYEGLELPSDVRGVLDALDSDRWDSIDDRGDGTVILYPADSHQNMYIGEWTQVQLIIKSTVPHWITRVISLYDAEHEKSKNV